MTDLTLTEVAAAIGTGLAALLVGLGVGIKRGRSLAIHDGDPATFSQAWMERAERAFKKCHDDASVITEHGFKITALEGTLKKLEGENLIRIAELMGEVRLLQGAVNALREDLASLRGEMGFERRSKARDGDRT